MKFLFLKRTLNWPLAIGHDVHTFHLAQALARLGHAIEFATLEPPHPTVQAQLGDRVNWRRLDANIEGQLARLNFVQRRFLRYWGVESAWLRGTAEAVRASRPDVVVASEYLLLPCLTAARGPKRIWYAADEYAWHHLSMFQPFRPKTWRHLAEAAIAAAYERAFASAYDRAWVVSPAERRAMFAFAGAAAVDVVANGVDGEKFQPGVEEQTPHSCVFWGRLDAGPNIQALEWFCAEIWPHVRQRVPDARFSVLGFAPTEAVRSLAGNGVEVVGETPDLAPRVRRHALAVMPFVSGGGIKNKVLEAAALGQAIVASPLGCVGLDARGGLPLVVARNADQWVTAVQRLWDDNQSRRRLGQAARAWVLSRHTWEAAARSALRGLNGGRHV